MFAKNGMVAFGLIAAICAMLIMSCSRSGIDSETSSEALWIWHYVPQPIEEGDAAERLRELIDHAINNCPESAWRDGSKLLQRIGAASDNSVEIVHTVIQPTRDHIFQWAVKGQVVTTEEWNAMHQCVRTIAEMCKFHCEPTEITDVAHALLLLGYQVSKNGEYLAMAVFRMQIWILAVDMLMATTKDAQLLKQLRGCLVEGIKKGRRWDENGLRDPGWENCEMISDK